MTASVVVVAGPSGSGKTDRLLARYRETLHAAEVGSALWISPTHRSAAEVRGCLLDEGLRACFGPAVMTFSQFAEQVLSAGKAVVQPITDLAKRQIVRRLIRREAADGTLEYFRGIADTTGLIDLVAEFIGELKRHEIWPDDFERACHQRGGERKDRELLSLYRKYQDHLNDNQLYDAEGRFWTARALLRDGQTRPFERVRLVIVDGFTDFTRTQHEILEILAHRATALMVSLPIEQGSDRQDLFAKPRRTRERFERTHKPLLVETLERPAQPAWPALAHVESELFKSPRLVRPAVDATGIEVIEAARAVDELYLIGRRIKRLLVEGDPTDRRPIRPGEIAVVLRTPAALAALVREAFDDLGLPYALDEGRPLSQTALAAALVALVRLHVEDWPFRGAVSLLAHNCFQPRWPVWRKGAVAATADRTIRSLQIPRGRTALLAALARRCEQTPTDNAHRGDGSPGDARDTLAVLKHLAGAFDRLPRRASAGAWVRALAALANETGIAPPAAARPADSLNHRDRETWDLILESLSGVEEFTTPRGAAPDEFDARELLALLTDIVRSGQLRDATDDVGRVRVLSAASARSLSIPYLFFAGLSERSFPPPERSDRLYSEAEYERLAASGLPLVLRAEASQEEMLLFYEVVTRARRRLYLSYPGLDEKGQPLLASPYLAELEQVCGGKVQRIRIEDLSPLPGQDAVASAADHRIYAVAQAAGVTRDAPADRPIDAAAPLAGLAKRPETRTVYHNIMAGLALCDGRSKREGFGPFEGMLISSAARERLAQQFPVEKRWSASRLEQYNACPYQFFLGQVLRLAPLAELTLATDSLARGSTMHDALARLHREVNERLGRAISPALSEAVSLFREAVERLLSKLGPATDDRVQPFQAALIEIDRRLIREWLDDYLAQHEKYDALCRDFDDPLAPAHFEVSFGDDNPSDDPLSSREPLALVEGDRRVLVRGRIDRVDMGRVAETPVFSVLDYKTGGAQGYSKKAIESGEALQVMLYALAAEQLFAREGRLAWAAGYWFVSDGGYPARQALRIHERHEDGLRPTDEWRALRASLVAHVLALVDGIRGGQFPVISRDDHCTSYCDFRTVCRVNQVRALEKTWEP